MPTLLTWMIVVIGALPALMAVIGVLILGKYPIDQEERHKIQEYIRNHQAKDVEG